MPRALTAQAEQARTRRWAEPIYLLELTLWRDKEGASPTSITLRLSDRARQALGQEWIPAVLDWGDLDDALNPSDPGASIGAFDVILSNRQAVPSGAARLSNVLRHGLNTVGSYDFAFGDAALYLLFRGGTSGDEIVQHRLAVEELTDVTEDRVTLRMSGVELELEDRGNELRVTTDHFPTADPDDVGAVVPWLFGKTRGERLLLTTAGIVQTLRGDITAVSPPTGGALRVSDDERLSRMPETGTLQIDDEQITYTGRNLTNLTHTGIIRGANGTVAQNHSRGASIFQVLSEYVGIVAENPTSSHLHRAVKAVRSDGALLAASSYTVELDNTTYVPGRRLVLVRFPVLPVIKKQVTLAVTDTTDVQDTIAVVDELEVFDTIATPDNIAFSTGAQESRLEPAITTLPITLVAPYYPNGPGFPGGIHLTSAQDILFSELPSGGALDRVFWEMAVELQNLWLGRREDAQFQYWEFEVGAIINFGATPSTTVLIYRQYQTGPANGGFPPLLIEANRLPVPLVSTTVYATKVRFYITVYRSPHNWINVGLPLGAPVDLRTKLSSIKATVRRAIPLTKSGQVTKTGRAKRDKDVHKAGQAAKVGTVTLAGNSSAETVLGTLTIDVDGVQDTSGGAISGTPNLLLENPTDVTRLLMERYYGQTAASLYHPTRWLTTRTTQQTIPLKWGFRWEGKPFSEFRALAGLQGQADLFQDNGLWIYAFRSVTTSTLTLDDRNVIGEPVISWTPRTDLVTALAVNSDWDSAESRWRDSKDVRSTVFADRWGTRYGRAADRGRRSLDLPWVRTITSRDWLAAYWLGQWERPRCRVRCTVTWEAQILEKADIITVNVPVLAPYGTLAFAVRRKRYLGAERLGLIEIEATELDFLPQEFSRTAQYGVRLTMNLAGDGGYRVTRALSLTRAAIYRVPTTPSLTRAASYAIMQTLDLARSARYVVLPVIGLTRFSDYRVAIKWDQAGIHWDSGFGRGEAARWR
jgi:hypothetical protein